MDEDAQQLERIVYIQNTHILLLPSSSHSGLLRDSKKESEHCFPSNCMNSKEMCTYVFLKH